MELGSIGSQTFVGLERLSTIEANDSESRVYTPQTLGTVSIGSSQFDSHCVLLNFDCSFHVQNSVY